VKLLSLDTSTNYSSVAIFVNGETVAHKTVVRQAGQSQQILPMVDDVLSIAQLGLKDLDSLAVSIGPGSFVGIRIGVGVAQGLALAADLKVIPVSSLAALAQSAFRQQQIERSLVSLNAHMGEMYFAHYQICNGLAQAVIADKLICPEDLVIEKASKVTLVGEGWEAYQDVLGAQLSDHTQVSGIYPNAIDVGVLAAAELDHAIAPELLRPVYLRDKTAWQ
jgi:tRNA threonylcarbamoyladenosine biosynthesis protein TsaB